MTNVNVNAVEDNTFKEKVLAGPRPVLVDFWATWCAPCRAIAPVVEELSSQYEGKVDFFKLNIDENPGIPGQYGVRGIPTLILFKDGKVVDQVVGAVPKAQLDAMIQRAI